MEFNQAKKVAQIRKDQNSLPTLATNKTGASASIINFITMKSIGNIVTPKIEGPFTFECKLSQLKISNDGYIIASPNNAKQ